MLKHRLLEHVEIPFGLRPAAQEHMHQQAAVKPDHAMNRIHGVYQFVRYLTAENGELGTRLPTPGATWKLTRNLTVPA